jgi:ABC-type uncharacterized transport system substrate-binding protein
LALELNEALDGVAEQWPGPFFWVTSPSTTDAAALPLFAATSRLHVPVMAPNRQQVDVGTLMSYGVDFPAWRRRMAIVVEQILGSGIKHTGRPDEQPTKLDFVIKQKTAKILAITGLQSLLLRADEEIQ